MGKLKNKFLSLTHMYIMQFRLNIAANRPMQLRNFKSCARKCLHDVVSETGIGRELQLIGKLL